VCGRMNHCIIGGVGDGDSDEDGRDEQRGVRAAAARGTPALSASWGSAAPEPPSFMASWEPSPMEMGSMGEAKRCSGGCKFVGGGVSYELGFLPLYSLSDSHLRILGRGLGIR
jgi:hypothetical protein